jgi:hypothetical protein
MQKRIPIFDTNVLADVQRGKISQSDWRALLRHRPRHGWRLSSVTAFELLAAVDAAPPENFTDVKERIALAYNLRKGRVLEDPRFLISSELLHIPAPEVTLFSFGATLRKYMDVARRAKENMADESYPAWRAHLRATGKRLPADVAEGIQQRSTWLALRPTYVKGLLAWLGASDEPSLVDELSRRLDAAMELFCDVVTKQIDRLKRSRKAAIHWREFSNQPTSSLGSAMPDKPEN